MAPLRVVPVQRRDVKGYTDTHTDNTRAYPSIRTLKVDEFQNSHLILLSVLRFRVGRKRNSLVGERRRRLAFAKQDLLEADPVLHGDGDVAEG